MSLRPVYRLLQLGLLLSAFACARDAFQVTCSVDADCSPGQLCLRGACTSPVSCSVDAECQRSERCVSDICRPDPSLGSDTSSSTDTDSSSGTDSFAGTGTDTGSLSGTATDEATGTQTSTGSESSTGTGTGTSGISCLSDGDCGDGYSCRAKACVLDPGRCRQDADCVGTPQTPACDLLTSTCVACVTDLHCPADMLCVEGNVCRLPAQRCGSDADCTGGPGLVRCEPTGKSCVACLSNADCTDPATPQCNEAFVCEAVFSGCREDADCGAGRCRVTDNVCVACLVDSDCFDGGRCQSSGQCVPKGVCETSADCVESDKRVCDVAQAACVGCVADGDCPDGTCLRSQCVPRSGGCMADQDCLDAALPVCDVGRRTCIARNECADDRDCRIRDGVPYCVAGSCVACDGDQTCGRGEVCLDHACVVTGCRNDRSCQDSPQAPVCRRSDRLCVQCTDDTHCADWNAAAGDALCRQQATCSASDGRCRLGNNLPDGTPCGSSLFCDTGRCRSRVTNADRSGLTVNPVLVVADGLAAAVVRVTLVDTYGAFVQGHAVRLLSDRGAADRIQPETVVSDPNGDAVFRVSSTVSGQAVLTARDEQDLVVLSTTGTVQFESVGADVARSYVTVFPEEQAADGQSVVNVRVYVRSGGDAALAGIPVSLASSRADDRVSDVVNTDGDGVASFAVTSRVAGESTFTATLPGGLALSRTDRGLVPVARFVAGGIAPDRSTLTSEIVEAWVGGGIRFRVVLRDGNDNPVGDTAVRVVCTGPATVSSPDSLSDATGEVMVEATAWAAGAYVCQVRAPDDTLLVGSSAEVVWKSRPVDVARSFLAASPEQQVADGRSLVTVRVSLRSSDDAPVAGVKVALFSDRREDTISAEAVSDAGGEAVIAVSSRTVGISTLAAQLPGGLAISRTVNGTALKVSFVAGPVSPDQSKLKAENAQAAVGSVVRFRVALRDANTHAVVGAVVRVVCSGSSRVSSVDVVTNAAGEALAEVAAPVAGTYVCQARAPDGSLLVATSVDVAWTASATVDANRSFLTLSPEQQVADGQSPVTVRVSLRSADDAPVAGMKVILVSDRREDMISAEAISDASGEASFSVRSPLAGTSTLVAQLPDNILVSRTSTGATAVVRFVAGRVSSAKSVLTAEITDRYVGENIRFQVVLRDAADNRLGGVAVRVVCNGTATASSADVVTDTVSGSAKIDVSTNVAGPYVCTARSPDGPLLADVPVNVIWRAGAVDLARSQVQADPSRLEADGQAVSTVRVRLRDGYGNPVENISISLLSSRGEGDRVAPGSAVSNAAGEALFSVSSAVVGTATLTAQAGDQPLQSQTVLSFVPGAADLSRSTLVVAGGPVVADGAQTAVATVQVVDARGNPVQGSVVEFSSSRGSDRLSLSSGVTDARGIATVEVRSTQAGVATLTALVDGLPLVRQGAVVFVAGPVEAQRSSVVVAPAVVAADGRQEGVVTVTLRDAFDNVVSGVSVRVDSSRGAEDAVTDASVSDAQGMAVFQITSLRTGTATLSATVRSAAGASLVLVDRPTLTFTARTVATLLVTVDAGQRLQLPADGTSGTRLRVRALASDGSPVEGATVQAVVAVGFPAVVGPSSTDALGEAFFSVGGTTTAGDYTLAFVSAGVQDSVVVSFGCVVDGSYAAEGVASSASACLVCRTAQSAAAWSPAADGTVCGRDSQCRAGTCVSIAPQGCSIGGSSVAAGAIDPGNPCQSCDPSRSSNSWTLVQDGTACGTAGQCRAGVCAAGCRVDSGWVADGTADPSSVCRACRASVQVDGWSALDDGTVCGPESQCRSGTCVFTGPPTCTIAGTTYDDGAFNPVNACEQCVPTRSTSSWSAMADGSSCQDGFGVCAGRICRPGCLIGGIRYENGDLNPADTCQRCDLSRSDRAWSGVTAECSAAPLTVSPTQATMGNRAGQTLQLVAAGGAGTYQFRIKQGSGSVSRTGLYELPAPQRGVRYVGVVQVAVSDGRSEAVATINVIDSNIVVEPSSISLAVASASEPINVTCRGGLDCANVTGRIVSGGGSLRLVRQGSVLQASVWQYQAPSTPGAVSLLFENGGSSTTVSVSVVGPSKVVVGTDHGCVLYPDGRVRCWGDNRVGQLGVGNTDSMIYTQAGSTQQPRLSSYVQPLVGELVDSLTEYGLDQGTGSLTAGDVWPSGSLLYTFNGGSAVAGRYRVEAPLRRWDFQSRQLVYDSAQARLLEASAVSPGQAVVGASWVSMTPVSWVTLAGPAVDLVAADRFTCALLASGAVQCWGANDRGQLGLGQASSRPTTSPRQVAGPDGEGTLAGVAGLYAGGGTVCAVLAADQGLRCWGDNGSGQAGRGVSSSVLASVGATSVDFGAEDRVRSVAIGAGHACALLFDDTVRCWGRPQGPAASVAEACVLGNGTLGEETLGDAAGEMQRLRPSLQAADHATALVAGAYTTCARLLDGTVRCWGMGDQLALGDLANTAPAGCSVTRAAVTVRRADGATLSGVVSLAMGASQGCARRQDGSVWCWGANDLGQAGAANGGGPVAGAARLDLGSGMVVQQLAAGMTAGHACAMTADGRIKCWGDNRRYQLLWPVADASPGRAGGSMGDRLPLLSLP